MAVGENTEARSVKGAPETANISTNTQIGAGREGTKQNNKILKNSIQGITKPSIRRLA